MEYKKNLLGIEEMRKRDEMAAALAQLEANVEYVAMMTDVEIEEEEDEEEE